jgi:hypothetical protein
MQAGIARTGRTTLAAIVAALMMLSVMFLLAGPAEADHQPPDDTYSSANDQQGENSNEGRSNALVSRRVPLEDQSVGRDGFRHAGAA